MSEYDYEDEQSETEARNPVRARMKELEKQLAEANQRAQAAEQAARKASFLEAGLNLQDKMTQYFVKAYDGELSPEAIKQAAVEANLISTPNNGEEAAAWKRTENVAQGQGTAQPPVDWNKRINEATSEEEVLAILAEARELL